MSSLPPPVSRTGALPRLFFPWFSPISWGPLAPAISPAATANGQHGESAPSVALRAARRATAGVARVSRTRLRDCVTPGLALETPFCVPTQAALHEARPAGVRRSSKSVLLEPFRAPAGTHLSEPIGQRGTRTCARESPAVHAASQATPAADDTSSKSWGTSLRRDAAGAGSRNPKRPPRQKTPGSNACSGRARASHLLGARVSAVIRSSSRRLAVDAKWLGLRARTADGLVSARSDLRGASAR